MSAKQEGENSANFEPLNPIVASRLARVSHYLERRIRPQSPAKRVQSALTIKYLKENGADFASEHSSMHDYIKGMTNKLLPSQTEGDLYSSIWLTNAYEETLNIIVAPVSAEVPELLVTNLKVVCGFTPLQMDKWISDITELQLINMARVIAESSLPLKYSWTEEELLQEISLATGTKASSLDEITAARFNADAAKGKYRDRSSLEGDFRLLTVVGKNSKGEDTNYYEVHITQDPERQNAPTYKLAFIQNAHTSNRALEEFKHTVDYCSGKGASQEIKYPKSA